MPTWTAPSPSPSPRRGTGAGRACGARLGRREAARDNPDLKFSIEGHTDDQGGARLNQPLSERRAAAVKAWLVKQGVAEPRLSAKGFGQTKPIDSNETAEGRANNRRVEFLRL